MSKVSDRLCSRKKCTHREVFRTGIKTCDQIRGRWSTHGGIDEKKRRIVLCEGEHNGERKGRRKPGEDQRLIEKATKANDWEVYSCGSRKETLATFDCLNEDGYQDLYSVVDLDESTIEGLRKKKGRERVLVWPGSRDLECFLLSTKAWTKVYTEVLPNIVNIDLFPKSEEVGDHLPQQFARDETASAHAWVAHNDRGSGKYLHIDYDRIESPFPEYLVQIYEDPREFEVSEEERFEMPSDISDVLVFLLDGQFPVITDYGIMPKEDRSMKMQGKRVLSLLASRIYNETKNNTETQVIHEDGIEKLRKSLAIPKNGYCSRLRELILGEITESEMQRAFPELAG